MSLLVLITFTFFVELRRFRHSAFIGAAPTGRIFGKFVVGAFTKICRDIADLVIF